MPRFAILHHEFPPPEEQLSHWDLLLEVGTGLRTWSLPVCPQPGTTCVARALPDHRLIYLDYEGPISGNRGSVSRVAQGSYTWLEPPEGSPNESTLWIVQLNCEALPVRLSLVASSGNEWQAQFYNLPAPA